MRPKMPISLFAMIDLPQYMITPFRHWSATPLPSPPLTPPSKEGHPIYYLQSMPSVLHNPASIIPFYFLNPTLGFIVSLPITQCTCLTLVFIYIII